MEKKEQWLYIFQHKVSVILEAFYLGIKKDWKCSW